MRFRISGFTIVEMVVVVAVIGIIAGISVVGFGAWQKSTAQKQLQSDLKQASVAMENAKNFGAGYPSSIPSSFQASSGVTLSFITGTSTNYCIQAVSMKDSSIVYHIDTSEGKEPVAGICSGSAPTIPDPTIASATTTSLTVTWPNVSGATSYNVKYGPAAATIPVSCTTSPCVISGLTIGTLYYVKVWATNAVGTTPSPTVGGWTALQNPASYSVSDSRAGAPQSKINVTLTGSGGACSVGSTEWKFVVTPYDPDSALGAASWQTSNSKVVSIPANGQLPPSDYMAYARARCNNGSSTSVEGSGYAAATY